MTRFYLIVTALLGSGALAQETAPTDTAPQADPNLWLIIAAAVGTLLLLSIVLKFRKPKKPISPEPEEQSTAPTQPKKKIENPITLKQQKPDAD